MSKPFDGITVRELIDYLEDFPDNYKVGFSHPAHDYWRTTLVSPVKGIDYANIAYSGYHTQFKESEKEELQDGDEEILVLG